MNPYFIVNGVNLSRVGAICMADIYLYYRFDRNSAKKRIVFHECLFGFKSKCYTIVAMLIRHVR